MQENEFFVHCNLSSYIFNPEIKLDGKWEVAAYDLALGNDLPSSTTTTTSSVTDQIELRKKDFPILGHPPKDVERYNSFSMLMKSHITERDRLIRPGDEAGTTALREAFKDSGMVIVAHLIYHPNSIFGITKYHSLTIVKVQDGCMLMENGCIHTGLRIPID